MPGPISQSYEPPDHMKAAADALADCLKVGVGSVVMIYEDPITKEKPEGEATLRELYRHNGRETYWRVEFLSEPGQFYERTLYDAETDAEESERE